ncbi:MAG: hypothetical protein Q8O60_08605 [Deltaproteobacteria bacterium]|nr:hypothetical protein [Deltaproteobacteria bacterium]MDP2993126.1 hypothetical protein [Deltaproteobacteria bacterium]
MDKPPYPKAAQEASQGVTHGVIEQESAEAIVGVNRRRAEHEAGKE